MTRRTHAARLFDLLRGHRAGLTPVEAFLLLVDHALGMVWP